MQATSTNSAREGSVERGGEGEPERGRTRARGNSRVRAGDISTKEKDKLCASSLVAP